MHRVEVHVDVVDGQIVVEPETNLRHKPKNVKIMWTLATQDWKFDDHGIDIVEITNQFRDAQRINHGKAYAWRDKNSDGKQYKYDVNLVSLDGKVKLKLDPLINNGGGG